MRNFLLILLIFILALTLRLINLPETLNFANDQGEFLIESAKILHGETVKLIGIYVSSKPVGDKYFFTGSQFLYLLSFFQFIFNYDPLKITAAFSFLNSLAVVLTALAAWRWFGKKTAIIAGLLFATNPLAINYSKIIWNPSVQSLGAVIATLLLPKRPLFSGLVIGILIAIEYSSVMLIPLALILVRASRRESILLVLGIILGLSNLILFDLRHDFYNSRLILTYYLSPNVPKASFGLSIHHLMPILPFIFIFISAGISKFVPKKVFIPVLMLLIVGQIMGMNTSKGFEMAKYYSYPDMVKAVEIINTDDSKKYNIAQIINGETRANALRYMVSTYKAKPGLQAYDQYGASDFLYVIHYPDQEVRIGGPYELSSFSDKRDIVWTKNLNGNIQISKLTRVLK